MLLNWTNLGDTAAQVNAGSSQYQQASIRKCPHLELRTQDRFPQGNKNIKGPLIESCEGPALAGHCSAKTQPGGQFGAGRRRVRGVLLVSPWATPETQGHTSAFELVTSPVLTLPVCPSQAPGLILFTGT